MKISCKINLSDQAPITLNKEVERRYYSNFIVIKSKYVYTVFKKKGKDPLYHVNITKIPSEKDVQLSMDHLCKIISNRFSILNYKIENITCSYDIGFNVPLIRIFDKLKAASFTAKVRFNPERFPGMFVNTGDNTVLLFSSGKMVVIGASKIENVKKSIQSILLFLKSIYTA